MMVLGVSTDIPTMVPASKKPSEILVHTWCCAMIHGAVGFKEVGGKTAIQRNTDLAAIRDLSRFRAFKPVYKKGLGIILAFLLCMLVFNPYMECMQWIPESNFSFWRSD